MDKITIKELATAEYQKAQLYQALLRVENQINRGADGYLFATKRITSADSPYTQSINDGVIICDSSAGSITINLLPALEWEQKLLKIKKISVSNTVTIDGNSAETIDDSATLAITANYEAVTLVAQGGEVWIV